MFRDEPGVLRIGTTRVTLSIPDSVVARVHERMSRPTPPETSVRFRKLNPHAGAVGTIEVVVNGKKRTLKTVEPKYKRG